MKKLIALVLALVLALVCVLGLVGCNNSDVKYDLPFMVMIDVFYMKILVTKATD